MLRSSVLLPLPDKSPQRSERAPRPTDKARHAASSVAGRQVHVTLYGGDGTDGSDVVDFPIIASTVMSARRGTCSTRARSLAVSSTEDPVELPRREGAGRERLTQVVRIDRSDLRVLAEEQIEHRLTGANSRVPLRGGKAEVENTPGRAAEVEDVSRLHPAYLRKQELDVIGFARTGGVPDVPFCGDLVVGDSILLTVEGAFWTP